jgi:hypothetical protein
MGLDDRSAQREPDAEALGLCRGTEGLAMRSGGNPGPESRTAISTFSVSEQKVIDAAPPQADLPHQEIKPERADIVGDQVERRIIALFEDLHIATALVAAFGVDGSGTAGI